MICVLLGRGVSNHPGLIEMVRDGAAPTPVRIVVQHTDVQSHAMRSADVACVEPSGLDSDRYVSHCLAICREHRVDVFLPGRDLEALAARAGEFESARVRLLTPAGCSTLDVLDDKAAFYTRAAASGVPTAEALTYTTVGEFEAAWTELRARYEVLCTKPSRSIFARGFRVIREDADPFADLFKDPGYRSSRADLATALASRASFQPMLLMPHLDGIEWSVDCVRTRDGALHAVARRKIREGTQEIVPHAELAGYCRTLAEAFGLVGLFNVQFKERGGVPYVLEINARASGGVGITRFTGKNLAWMAIADALGLPIANTGEPFHPSTDRITVVQTTDWAPSALPPPARGRTPVRGTTKVALSTGTLQVDEHSGPWRLADLVDFGARDNARRGFLFVSRVLGKHLPVTPARMAASHSALAGLIPQDLPGPVLIVGLAETATGLGLGVHDAFIRASGRADVVAMHTTRHPGDGERLAFEESHSHAPDQWLCLPEEPAVSALFAQARSLVIVDDELSTGKTALALWSALRDRVPTLERVVCAALLDMRPAGSDGVLDCVSLCRAHSTFEPATESVASPRSPAPAARRLPATAHRRWGRFGHVGLLKLDTDWVQNIARSLPAGAPVRLLATGETMFPAFVLGRALEALGFAVLLQSTTRSPVLLEGAIERRLPAPDNFGAGIPFFLYNAPLEPGPAGTTLLLHEPGATEGVGAFCERIGARPISVPDA